MVEQRTVEVKIPVQIVSQVDLLRKQTTWYSNMTFSDYLNMLIVRAVDYEKERIENFQKVTAGEDPTIIPFSQK